MVCLIGKEKRFALDFLLVAAKLAKRHLVNLNVLHIMGLIIKIPLYNVFSL